MPRIGIAYQAPITHFCIDNFVDFPNKRKGILGNHFKHCFKITHYIYDAPMFKKIVDGAIINDDVWHNQSQWFQVLACVLRQAKQG